MATISKVNISKTEKFFWIFSCVPEIYVKLGVFKKKRISHIAKVSKKLLTAKEVAT